MTANDAAAFFINQAIAKGHPLSPVRLQDLLYCAEVQYLSEGQPAFWDLFEAWEFGPVLPELWEKYSDALARGRITRPVTEDMSALSSEDRLKLWRVFRENEALSYEELSKKVKRLSNHAYEKAYRSGGRHPVIDLGLPVRRTKKELSGDLARIESDAREIFDTAREPKIQFLAYEIMHLVKRQEKTQWQSKNFWM